MSRHRRQRLRRQRRTRLKLERAWAAGWLLGQTWAESAIPKRPLTAADIWLLISTNGRKLRIRSVRTV